MATAPEKELLNKLGEQIAKIRKKKKLSYRKVSYRCNLDYSKISKIEKGEVNITFVTLIELAKGLEVHPKELLDIDFENLLNPS